MAIRGLGQALGIIGQGVQQKAQLDWQEQRQANLERIRAEELEAARTERKGEFEANKKLQQAQIDNTKDYHDKSLGIQAENMREDNKARKAQLGISQEGLNLQKDNSEYSRVADAYTGAMAGVAGISSRIAEVEKMQPKIGPDGQPLEDLKTFNDRKIEMLATLEGKLEVERERAKVQADKIHAQFPQYKKYFAPEPQQKAPSGAPALLQRPSSSTRYDPSAKSF